jgi:hypothetical protein
MHFSLIMYQYQDSLRLTNRSTHEHVRILYSNFFMIECGVGFNFDTSKRSNSKITVDTIFDKFNYSRINNHLRNLNLKKRKSTVER